MLAELTIIPVGADPHTSEELAGVLEVIEASGVPYQLTPTATCIEGSWSTVMPLVQKCHERVRKNCPHVVTLLKLEDDERAEGKLAQNVRSVAEKADRPLTASKPSR